MKLGILGAGGIVPFHLKALQSVGFIPTFIGATSQSTNARRLSQEFDIPQVLDSANDVIDYISRVDSLLIATSSNLLYYYLKLLKPFKVPMLIEKPVFTNFDQLQDFKFINELDPYVMIGYNRRFYESVIEFRRDFYKNPGGQLDFVVPEMSSTLISDFLIVRDTLINNTVHMLDLLLDLIPIEIENCRINVMWTSEQVVSVEISTKVNSTKLNFNVFFSVPDNYSVRFRTNGLLLELRPLEVYRKYEGISVIEPSASFPIRTYQPKLTKEVISKSEYAQYGSIKPGFLGQALEFRNFVNTGRRKSSASMHQAASVSSLAFKLIDAILSQKPS